METMVLQETIHLKCIVFVFALDGVVEDEKTNMIEIQGYSK
jgi:hypothetical protein